MITGCYVLHLYCDNSTGPKDEEYITMDDRHEFREFPHVYSAELGSRCRTNARKDGWILKRNGQAICPKCSGKKAKRK